LGTASTCVPGCGTEAELCRVLKELSFLVEISRTLESSLELRDVVRPVLQRLADRMGMKRGTITIVNRDTRKITIEEAVGLTRSTICSQVMPSLTKSSRPANR